jgi:hypothetical protein
MGIAPMKLKRHAPVAVDPYRPAYRIGGFQSMQPETGNIHIGRRGGRVQRKQQDAQPIRVVRLYARQTAGLEESP